MVSTPSASAARAASRMALTEVACGWSWTPTRKAIERRRLPRFELELAAPVGEADRRLAGEQSLQRLADEVGSPSGREATGTAVEELRDIRSRGEYRGIEPQFVGLLRQPCAQHGDRGLQRPVD